MQVKIIDPSNDKRWDTFVLEHKFGSIYHHSSWKEVIERTYSHATPLYFILEDNKGRIKAGIPFFLIKSWLTGTRLVSLPFTYLCDVLADTWEDVNRLLEAVIDEKEKFRASYVEIRTQRSYDLFNNSKTIKRFYYKTFILTLNNEPEILRKSFHKTSVQQRINKAKRENTIVRAGKTEEDMRIFYNLHILTRKKHGLPPQPYKFFHNLWRIMHPRGLFNFLLAEHDSKVIAGAILLKFKDTVYYQESVSDSRFLKKYSPNHFLIWKAIEMACNEGFKYFDFGRTSPKDRGLIDFKRRWGTEEHEIPYLYFPAIKGITSIEEESIKYRLVTTMGRKMPLSLAKIWGGFLYKHWG